MKTLVIDISNLAYRRFHAMGDLSHDGMATSVMCGVLMDIRNLQKQFHPDRFAFCFDGGYSKRTEIFPDYKKKKKPLSRGEIEVRSDVAKQIARLRRELLPDIGYKNLFWQLGYEADDLIASVVWNNSGEKIIVSTDNDLYQLLACQNVSIWNPVKKHMINERWFMDHYGIDASLWAWVKAVGGCASDGIPGIRGVGEKKAIQYLREELKPHTIAFRSIQAGEETFQMFLSITQLPFPHTQVCSLEDEEVTEGGWREVAEMIGARSLLGIQPRGVRKDEKEQE